MITLLIDYQIVTNKITQIISTRLLSQVLLVKTPNDDREDKQRQKTVIDPKKRNYTEKELIENYNYPNEYIDEDDYF